MTPARGPAPSGLPVKLYSTVSLWAKAAPSKRFTARNARVAFLVRRMALCSMVDSSEFEIDRRSAVLPQGKNTAAEGPRQNHKAAHAACPRFSAASHQLQK